MEERFGATGTLHDGVFFTEQAIAVAAQSLGPLSVEISRQNSNLAEVKTRMAEQAKARGANAIANFKYGQRKHKSWQLILTLKWDTESWFGEGEALQVDSK